MTQKEPKARKIEHFEFSLQVLNIFWQGSRLRLVFLKYSREGKNPRVQYL